MLLQNEKSFCVLLEVRVTQCRGNVRPVGLEVGEAVESV